MATIADVLAGATSARQRDEALAEGIADRSWYRRKIDQQQADEKTFDTDLAKALLTWQQQQSAPPSPAPSPAPPSMPSPGMMGQFGPTVGAPPMAPPPMMGMGQPGISLGQSMAAPPPMPQMGPMGPQGGGAPQPQPPAPGAPSVPMMAPGGGAPPPAAPMAPQGFQLSPAAPSSLRPGAGEMPSGVPPTFEAMVETVPAKKLPAPMAMLETLTKQGVEPGRALKEVEKYLPLYNAQQKEELEQLKIKNQVQKEATEFVKARTAYLKEQHAGGGAGGTPTMVEKEARRMQELEEQGKTSTTEYKQLKAHLAKVDRIPGTTVNIGGGLTTDAKRLAAEQYLATGQLPAMYRDQKGRAEIMDLAAQIKKERGGDLADVPGERAGFKADAASLTQRQRFVDTGNQFIKNMQKQADLVEKYMEKGTAGAPPAFNKWIQAGRKQLAGDPDVSALDTALRGLAREHQRIVTGVTSNAQLHVAAQQTADELLNIAQTPAQIRATLKVMREEAENAVQAGKEEVADIRARMKGRGGAQSDYVETRTTKDGRKLGKKADGTIEEIK